MCRMKSASNALWRTWTGLLLAACASLAVAADRIPAHGLWVWKSPSLLAVPHGADRLREFCQSVGVNEVYVSFPAPESRLARLIALLHQSNIRVEALLSSVDADEPGAHREELLKHVRAVVQFNRSHPQDRFDGIHLDIEPQQRPENKGTGNLRFLPGLVDAYRAVHRQAKPAHLTVNADIQNKLLKGSLEERKLLLTSLPRLTLMLYELSHPGDGESNEQKANKLRLTSRKLLELAYAGLPETNLATMGIGVRSPDYRELLPDMLKALDQANQANPHYRGCAQHSYNDSLEEAE